jgi:hypothetical protein
MATDHKISTAFVDEVCKKSIFLGIAAKVLWITWGKEVWG